MGLTLGQTEEQPPAEPAAAAEEAQEAAQAASEAAETAGEAAETAEEAAEQSADAIAVAGEWWTRLVGDPNDPDTFVGSVVADPAAWGWALVRLLIAVLVALILHRILFAVLGRVASRTRFGIDNVLLKRLRAPAAVALPLLAIQLVLPSIDHLAPQMVPFLRHANGIGMIVVFAWLLMTAVRGGEQFILHRHDVAGTDNFEARRVHTQLEVITRAVVFLIGVVAAAAILMTFPAVRQFGASILASAGLAGLVLGLAARPALENLIAGLQIAITQPVRLDDVVIMDGEWGRIEEIASTYIVVRIWDQRRLIVPFSKVIGESFQNWTRSSSDILGTVYVYCDYTVPVASVREQVQEIVKDHPKWDGRVASLVVTDAKERTLELRALISAKDSSDAWDLRCDLREKLVDYLQREFPASLPRVRAELDHLDGRGNGSPARLASREPGADGNGTEHS